MQASRSSTATWWGRFVMLAHREPPQRTMCPDCMGSPDGTLNGVRCRGGCNRGWFDTDQRGRRQAPAAEDAY